MHLKGPWQFEWIDQSTPSGPSHVEGENSPLLRQGRAKMPADWRSLFGEASGCVRFRRRFHCPTNLEPREQVFIVFDGVGGAARVALNENLLGTSTHDGTTAEFDITDLLEPANELVVDLEFDTSRAEATDGGLWGPVAIEIRST